MVSKDMEMMIHRDIMALLPEMQVRIEMFDYLMKTGFSPTEANNAIGSSQTFKIVFDAMIYDKYYK